MRPAAAPKRHIALRLDGELYRQAFDEYRRWRGMSLEKNFSAWMRHVLREKLGHERLRRVPRNPRPTLEFLLRNSEVTDEIRNLLFHLDCFVVLTFRGDFYVAKRHFEYLS